MDDAILRMIALAGQGFHCSQILLFMGLEAQGKNNPDLIRAMGGLAGGLGFTGETCGALTGGACLIGLYTGRGTPEEQEDERLKTMIGELVDWFSETFGKAYGGIQCRTILGDDPGSRTTRCPKLVFGTYEKVKELFLKHGLELSGGK